MPPPPTPAHSNNKIRLSASFWKELIHKFSVQIFHGCHLTDRHPNHLASRVYLPKSHRTIKQFLNRHMKMTPSLYTWAQCKQRRQKMSISWFLPRKDLIAYFSSCCLSAWLLISLHLGVHCSPSLWDTDGSWHTLKHEESLRTKIKGLGNHKGLRGNQEPGPR